MPTSPARSIVRKSFALFGPALLVAAAGTPVLASAASAATPASPWSADATSALLHVQVLSGLPLADLVLGPAEASTDSSKSTGAATARGANLDALALGTLSLSGILTDISQSSTPGSAAAPATGQLLAVPLVPVATAGVGTATAQTADISNGSCPADGSPAAHGVSNVAGAAVLPGAPGVGDVADVAQTVQSDGGVTLASVAGQAGKSVSATATSSLTQISLLGGTVIVGVAHAPVLTATATGTAGGGAVTYTAPIVTVTIAGTTQTLSAPGQGITIPGLGELSLGVLTKTIAPDGTKSTGSAALLHLAVAPAGTPVASVDLAPETATATAPAGGVLCAASTGGAGVVPPATTPPATTPPAATPPADPFSEFHKGLSSSSVAAGQTFDSPLIVSNRSTCTITDAVITDVVKGGATLVKATPSPTSSHDASYSYGPLTLTPGQLVTIAQTFKAPSSSAAGTTFSDTATVTGTCAGVPETGTDTLNGPTVGSGSGACDLQRSTFSSDHREVAAGEAFDDVVNLFDAGAADCHDITTTVTIPTGTVFSSCTESCTHSGDTVTWKTGTLAAGASESLVVTLLAPAAPTASELGSILAGKATIKTGGQVVKLATALPRLTSTSVLNPIASATRGTGSHVTVVPVSHAKPTAPVKSLAFTGAPPIAVPALLLLLAAGVGTRMRRRRTT